MIYRIYAIVLLLAFYGCYFQKLLRQKKRGIQTNQMGKGKTGAAKTIECTLSVATILAPLVELGSILCNTAPLPPPARIAGAVLGTVGVAVFITAVVQMRDSWRAGVPAKDKTTLVTGGIFSISRNPAFLGFDLVYIGILMQFYNHVLFAATVFAALMMHLQIVNVEEEFMQKTFGADYHAYRKRVNRYLGRKRAR